jgi:hypothetical protein
MRGKRKPFKLRYKTENDYSPTNKLLFARRDSFGVEAERAEVSFDMVFMLG